LIDTLSARLSSAAAPELEREEPRASSKKLAE